MSEFIQISCPGCNAVFELPQELGGELGECTECSAIFEIPRVDAIESGNLETTDTGAIKVDKAEADEGTNTVKLSRSSIGMVPDIKDNFQFDVVNKAPAAPKPSATSTSAPRKKSFTKKTKTGMDKAAAPKPAPKPKKKWWQFWK